MNSLSLRSLSGCRLLSVVIVVFSVAAMAAPQGVTGEEAPGPWARLLDRFVTENGSVHYKALAADRELLHAELIRLASVEPKELSSRTDSERMAFWINAYNAITVAAVVEEYPIRGRGLSGLRYPDNSIRQIDGVWTEARWTVAGRKLSLDAIENTILRGGFGDPRIHLALVCASMGCPPLRREPYLGARLDEQLDDQARRYLARPSGLRLGGDGHSVRVSKVFKWFKKDFGGYSGVRAFLEKYAPPKAAAVLANKNARIRFLDYNWALNDAGSR